MINFEKFTNSGKNVGSICDRRLIQIATYLELDKNLMRKIPFIIFFCFILKISFGQKYYSLDIIKKADSIMIATVGQKVFNEHFKFDSASYFELKNTLAKTLTKTKRIKGKIKLINVRYTFYIKKFEQPLVWTGLVFDRDLKLKNPIDTSFIPKFIFRGTPNDFLTEEVVLKMAKDKFIKKGIKPIESSLTYDHYKRVYVWSIVNIINEWKDVYNNIQKEVELLEINAINGQQINFYTNALQGIIY